MSAKVHTLNTPSAWPARRCGDMAVEPSRRSSPTFEIPVPLPMPELPLTGTLLSTSFDERAMRRMAAQLEADKRHRAELRQAQDKGFSKGDRHGFTRGWLWGVVCGAVGAGITGVIAVKAWAWHLAQLGQL
jgi:hypothetical protein